MLALVVHGDVRVEDPLLHPAPPILERLAVRTALLPTADRLRARAVGNGVRADAEVRLHRGGLEVDLAHDVRHLVTSPLRPLRIVRERPIRTPGRCVEPVECNGVVSPRVVLRPGWKRQIGVAHAIEVEAVNVVISRHREEHLGDIGGCVGMAGVEEPVRGRARALAQCPVVLHSQPVFVSRLARSMQVERVIRVDRRRRAVPQRRRDDPGVDLNSSRVRLRDDRSKRVVRPWRDPGLGSRHAGAIAETIATPADLHDQRVDVRRLCRVHELRDLRVVEDPFAKRVHPERTKLACRGARLRRGPQGHNDRENEEERECTPHDDLRCRDAGMVRGHVRPRKRDKPSAGRTA